MSGRRYWRLRAERVEALADELVALGQRQSATNARLITLVEDLRSDCEAIATLLGEAQLEADALRVERDQARRIAVGLEQEIAHLRETGCRPAMRTVTP